MTPVDFGWWRLRNGQRRLLSWDPETGLVCLDRDPIAVCHDEDDLRRRLAPADHGEISDSYTWLRRHLEGVR